MRALIAALAALSWVAAQARCSTQLRQLLEHSGLETRSVDLPHFWDTPRVGLPEHGASATRLVRVESKGARRHVTSEGRHRGPRRLEVTRVLSYVGTSRPRSPYPSRLTRSWSRHQAASK